MFLLFDSGYFGCSYSSTLGTLGVLTLQLGVLWVFLLFNSGTLGVLTLQLGVLWVFLLLDSGYFRCSYSYYFGCSYSSTRGTLGVLTLRLWVL